MYKSRRKTQKFQPFFDIFNGTRDIGNFLLKAFAHAHPHSDFSQPIKRNLKVQPALENQIISTVFRYLQRYSRYWQFCNESFCACAPPTPIFSANIKKPQSTTPFRKPQNFNRFLISSTVLEILAILY